MQGIERSLESVSRRAKFSNKMDKSVLELKKDYNQFNKEFNQFYPYVSEFVRRDLAGEL
jgi:acyl carrier protein phosphodiesterase